MDRRYFVTAAAPAIALGTVVASCGTNVVDVIKTVADFYQKIQDTVASVCATVQHNVPTIDFIMELAQQILGATLTQANLAQAVANIQKFIDAAAAQCQAPPAPTASGTKKFY